MTFMSGLCLMDGSQSSVSLMRVLKIAMPLGRSWTLAYFRGLEISDAIAPNLPAELYDDLELQTLVEIVLRSVADLPGGRIPETAGSLAIQNLSEHPDFSAWLTTHRIDGRS